MKKLIAVFLSAVMLLGSLSVVSFAQQLIFDDSFTVGDANGDGAVNPLDALTIRKYLATDTNDRLNAEGADLNCDGSVTALDALALRKVFAGVKTIESYDNSAQLDRLTIAGNDISEYTILVPEGVGEDDNLLYAAEQLLRYIYKATGVYPDICYGTATKEHVINFKEVEPGSELEAKLEIENYIYEVADGNLNIYGTRRGNMYAVYEILEQYLGYRFYDNDFSFVYENRTVDIPEGTYVFFEPKLDFRFVGQAFGRDSATVHYFPRRLNGTQIYGYDEAKFGTLTGPHSLNAHSYGYYWRMATGDPNATSYYDKYLSGVQQDEFVWYPCSTSDEDYEILFRGLLETMRMIQTWSHVFRKDTSSMSFSICDNSNYCECYDCKYVTGSGVDAYGRERLNSGVAGLNIWLVNRAARDIKKYYPDRAAGENTYQTYEYMGEPIYDEYPDMKLYTILYAHDFPNKVLPEENVILMSCGLGCNNHWAGSNGCEGQTNIKGSDPLHSLESLKRWGEVCRQTGAELWFWYYPVNYNTYLTDTPCIFNIYYDFTYIVRECNVTGIFYEGGGQNYNFEYLKAHLASMILWEPDMSYDRFIELMKEYLMIYYGDGYEYIYQYIVLHDEAGNATGDCFINNCDRPGDMFSYEYIRDNYEEMRSLLVSALEMTEDQAQIERIEKLIVCCDFLGLSANYETYYQNGTADQKKLYEDRYTDMYNYIRDHEMQIYTGNHMTLPETLDVSVKPMIAFYEFGSYREKNKDTWGYYPMNF